MKLFDANEIAAGYYDMSHTITCNLVTQTPNGNISINKYPHSEYEVEHLLMSGVDRDESIDGWCCDSGYLYWIEKGHSGS
jgi:hypothetical protein